MLYESARRIVQGLRKTHTPADTIAPSNKKRGYAVRCKCHERLLAALKNLALNGNPLWLKSRGFPAILLFQTSALGQFSISPTPNTDSNEFFIYLSASW